MWETFENAGDVNSKNVRLQSDADTIFTTFHESRFLNPSLYIDGEPYHEPHYPDGHFSEDQMIADVCAALL